MENSPQKTISFLHLTDLHFGMNFQGWLMPSFKTALLADLKDIHSRAGRWDFVIFSGDLTQKGTKEEYSGLSVLLREIWSVFRSLNFNPKLFISPGNHDLCRPSVDSPYAHSLVNWWSNDELSSNLFRGKLENYKTEINSWFSNYREWIDEISKDIDIMQDSLGFFVGDISARIAINDISVGLIGLNSTWLQCNGQDFYGKLLVHPEQLNSVTDNEPDKWVDNNVFNLLITHHPYDWLHERAKSDWDSEINTQRRFDAHLYGHMHASKGVSTSTSGSVSKNVIQGASLFGLEKYGTKNEEREHGYSLISLIQNDTSRLMRIWPRKLYKKADGSRAISANQDWHLISDSYCDIQLPSSKSAMDCTIPISPTNDVKNKTEVNLSRLGKVFSNLEPHSRVRESEYSVFDAEIKADRLAWLVADWGMGGDEFIANTKKKLTGTTSDIYFLDCHQFTPDSSIEDVVKDKLNCSIGNFCDSLASKKDAFLVLDDVPVDLSRNLAPNLVGICTLVSNTAKVLLDYCPSLSLIIRSRINPGDFSFIRTIEIGAMDEAETTVYVSSHETLKGLNLSADHASKIFRHTDGLPQRVDTVISEIEIVGINGLIDLNSDLSGKIATLEKSQNSIILAINELADSEDESHVRAFELLKVLSIFPKGVQLQRIKRFNGAKGFHSLHADILMKKAFVDSVDVLSFGANKNSISDGKALVVRRPVREHLIQSLDDDELKILTEKALVNYFGSSWAINGIKTPSHLNLDNSNCEAREISNCSTLVLREVRDSIKSDDEKRVSRAVALVDSYVAKIKNGGHYRYIVDLYEDVFQIFEDGGIDIDNFLGKKQYAESLRMIARESDAISVLTELEKTPGLSNSNRQSIYISLALSYEFQKGGEDKVIEYAKLASKIDSKSNFGIQARSLIVEHDPSSDSERMSRLILLQKEAEKKKAPSATNNILIVRTHEDIGDEAKLELLYKVFTPANKSTDPYNYTRATLRIANIILKNNGRLPIELLKECISAYQYLHNQRLDALFKSSHSILWQHFSEIGDSENMLNLFKHSSLVWRLRGKLEEEKKYMQDLFPRVSKIISLGMRAAAPNVVYLLTRLTSNNNKDKDKDKDKDFL